MEIKEVLKKMTLLEKIRLCVGKNFWQTKGCPEYDIPELFMCDGPTGLRKQEISQGVDMLGINNSIPATCFPASVTTSNTWDKDLLYKIGEAIGEEALDQKVGMVLGPGINIKRNPLCGRNFEYFSEDPVLTGKLASQYVKGMQEKGVACSLKHFACNSQELDRFTSDGVVDERTLREIYLKAFEIVVKQAKPQTIMSAYPKINGVHCSDDKKLLTDILRDEWGFDGMVVTDWGGMSNRIEAFKAGNDLAMPGDSDYMEKDIIDAVNNGLLNEEDIDRCLERIIKLALEKAELLKKDYLADYQKHHKLAVEVASKGAVLLKNDNNLLPLNEKDNILFVSNMFENARYQGAGSSHVNPKNLVQPKDCFKDYDYLEICDSNGVANEEQLEQLSDKASKADVVVVFAGLPASYESEGFDRDNMLMPDGHIKMIETAAKANRNVVVVLQNGAAVECDFADDVSSIIYMGLAGEGVGEAAYNVLFGKVNPSGKLSESWPYHYDDVVSSDIYCKTKDALYMEGIYVGYRYYDKADVSIRYPFGYGLSYTSFKFDDFKVNNNLVTVKITNTGKYDGEEVVQLYIGQDKPIIHRPIKELKDFEKVFLKKGDSKTITFKLQDDYFTLWNDGFKKIKGNYHILVGSSSQNIIFDEVIAVDGETIEAASWQKDSWYEKCIGKPNQEDFEKMLGRKYEAPRLIKGQFTMENTVEEMKDYSIVMKMFYKGVEKTIAKGFGGKIDYNNPEFKMFMKASAGSPLRSMKISSGIKGGLFEGLLAMANGQYIKGIIKMIKG